jgi:hypothetical protein
MILLRSSVGFFSIKRATILVIRNYYFIIMWCNVHINYYSDGIKHITEIRMTNIY